MNADPAAQAALLELQSVDSELARLAHRRRTHPSLAAIADAQARGTDLHARTVQLQMTLADIAGEQSRLEADIDVVRQREARDQKLLESGGVAAKEASSLEHELQSLRRRQSTLEDETLDVMERRELADAELSQAQAAEAEVSSAREAAEKERDAVFAEIDASVTERTGVRNERAAAIPADLLALYDKLRAQHDGVGAAALKQRRCEGCRIELAGSELGAVRAAAPDDVLRCDNCRRILVRTAESGL